MNALPNGPFIVDSSYQVIVIIFAIRVPSDVSIVLWDSYVFSLTISSLKGIFVDQFICRYIITLIIIRLKI